MVAKPVVAEEEILQEVLLAITTARVEHVQQEAMVVLDIHLLSLAHHSFTVLGVEVEVALKMQSEQVVVQVVQQEHGLAEVETHRELVEPVQQIVVEEEEEEAPITTVVMRVELADQE